VSIRPRTALLGVAACVAVLALVWFAAFHVRFVGHLDHSIYLQFGGLRAHRRISGIAGHLVRPFDPNPYVYLVLLPLVVALLRGRPRVVLAVAAIVLGANTTTEVLKHLIGEPRAASLFAGGDPALDMHSWPSGHSTAVMSLVLASVLAAPARLRPAVAALGASLAIAVGYSVVETGMHYATDVVGGFLVAAAWTLSAVAVLAAAERWRPVVRGAGSRVSVRAAVGAPGAVLAAALLLSAILLAVHPHDVVAYARAHEAFVVGAAGIAALSLGLSTGVVLSVRR
jgi:membrane-associated phospholipid phosphatase